MSKGTEGQLGQLHGRLTKYYNHRLDQELDAIEKAKSGEDDEEDFTMPLSPAELTAMNNFLKQNEITCSADEGDGMNELQKKLQAKQKRGKLKLASVASITGE